MILFESMECRSIAYSNFSKGTVDVQKPPIKAILETIKTGIFPGSQLYLYYKISHPGTSSLNSSEFITDTAFIYKYRMEKEDNTEKLLSKYFSKSSHVDDVYSIIKKAWEILNDAEISLHPYA